MTNEVTVHGQYTKEQLLAMSGQMLSGNKDFLGNIFVNKDGEDKFGNQIPVGTFTFQHKEFGNVYSKRKTPILFRPYIVTYRYSRYDETADNGKGATVSRSTLETDFFKEFISDTGEIKAGKGNPAYGENAVKCKIHVFGTVSFEGTDAKGNVVNIVDYPTFVKLGGKRFLDYTKMFKELTQAHKLIFQYDLALEVLALGQGKYATDVKWNDLTKEHEITDEVIKNLENFGTHINLENQRIEAKYNRLVSKAPTAADDEHVLQGEDNLASDLVDVEDEVEE